MYKKTSVIMAAMLAAVLAVGLTANHAFASVAGNKNQGTTNVAIGGDGGIGGAGGAGGTAIGGNGNCHNCGDNGNANATYEF
jgi:hypothetical protein